MLCCSKIATVQGGASYAVMASVGRLTAAELSLAANGYDPDEHYHEVRRKWWGISITQRDGRRETQDLWASHGKDRSYK